MTRRWLQITLNLDTQQPGGGTQVSQFEVLAQVVLHLLDGCLVLACNGDIIDEDRDDEAHSISKVDPDTVLAGESSES